MADYDLMAVWTLYCIYQPYWVYGFKGYLVHTTDNPLLWNEQWRIWPSLGCPGSHSRGRPCGRLWFHGRFYPNHPNWVHGSKCYLVHIAHIPALLWNQNRVWPSLGCCRSHNQGRPCGRLWFHGSLEPVLYVPAILGLWVQGLYGTYSSYTRLTVESKSRIWPSFGCCRSHKQGRPCGRLWFHGSLGPVLYVPAILGLWV